MPPHRYIRIGWFNRQTKENGAGEWVLSINMEYLKRHATSLNKKYLYIMHWVEEQHTGSPAKAINLNTNIYHNNSNFATASLPPPPSSGPPPPAPYPPPYPLPPAPPDRNVSTSTSSTHPSAPPSDNITQHLYGDP
jgi:hypothetical protein